MNAHPALLAQTLALQPLYTILLEVSSAPTLAIEIAAQWPCGHQVRLRGLPSPTSWRSCELGRVGTREGGFGGGTPQGANLFASVL